MNAVDLFAGAGGWSHGWRCATGSEPMLAVNHCDHAIRLHKLNHPGTQHEPKDVWKVDPATVLRGRRVDWLHGSPDCTHFSRAKGGKPRKQRIRMLAWVLARWAKVARPRFVSLENVAEFLDWGPLDKDGHPIKARKGETFRRFVGQLRRLGYVVDWRVLCAADFGAPTIRKRLFLIARNDGMPICWPAPTHANPAKRDLFTARLQPWRTAADCIDWSIQCPSIFTRKRPLAPATCRRIAAGIVRFVLQGKPFLVCLTHGGRLESTGEPLRTITTANGGERALVAPTFIETAHGDFAKRPGARTTPATVPLGVVTGSNNHALVAPTLIQAGYGEREGQAPRVLDLQEPLGTVVAGGAKHALVASSLVAMRGTGEAHLHGEDPAAPLRTVSAGGQHHALVAAFLQQNFTGMVGKPLRVPVPTITAIDHHSLVAAHLTQFREGDDRNRSLDEPVPTITSGAGSARPAGAAHATGLVAAFLTTYYGQGGGTANRVDAPTPAVVTKARHGLVTVSIDGTDYVLADIGLRMLSPRELARAQGFPDSYQLEGSKSEQIARVGNSVCPQVAAAIVRANVAPAEAVVA